MSALNDLFDPYLRLILEFENRINTHALSHFDVHDVAERIAVLHEDPDGFNVYNQFVHQKLARAPWELRIDLDSALKPGASVQAVLLPDGRARNRLGCHKLPVYSDGYDLPYLLLKESISPDTYSKLSAATYLVSQKLGISFMKGVLKDSFAIAFLVYLRILQQCVADAVIGAPPLISRRNIKTSDQSLLVPYRQIRELSPDEQIQLEVWLNRAPMRVADLMDTYDNNVTQILESKIPAPVEQPGFLNAKTLPLTLVTYDQWNRVAAEHLKLGEDFEVPSVPIDYRDAEFIRQNTKAFAMLKAELPNSTKALVERIADVADEQAAHHSEFIFRKDGDFWTVTYEKNTHYYKDRKGFQYIRELLEHPGKSLEVGALFQTTAGIVVDLVSDAIEEALDSEVLRATEALRNSDIGYSQLKVMIRKLEQKRSEAVIQGNGKEERKLDAEIKVMRKALNSTYDIYGRIRDAASPREKMRQTMTHAISLAMRSIRKHNPSCADHLKESLVTGSVFSYRPAAPLNWVTR